MNTTTSTTAPVRPIPLSAIALVLAYAAGMLGYTMFGWALFAAGAFAWMKFDGKILAKLLTRAAEQRPHRLATYSMPPALALLAYLMLAKTHADLTVSCALAFHAVLVWGLLIGSAYPVPRQTS
ncbi:MAG TPA: hypothetical protein VF670_17455 [Duganella sp.]|jgi:hypothetical protein